MSSSIVKDANMSNEFDIQSAEKELIEKLAEAEKYTNEECMEFEAFYNQLKEKYFGKI